MSRADQAAQNSVTTLTLACSAGVSVAAPTGTAPPNITAAPAKALIERRSLRSMWRSITAVLTLAWRRSNRECMKYAPFAALVLVLAAGPALAAQDAPQAREPRPPRVQRGAEGPRTAAP